MRRLLRICSCFVILIFPLISNTFKLQNSQLYEVSKRDLRDKEMKYLKDNPLSEDMKKFIKRSKRRTKGAQLARKKNEVLDKEHMYVVENGEIKPLKDMEFSPMDEDEPPKTGNFTVVPLIIPFSFEMIANETEEDNSTDFGAEVCEETTTCVEEPSPTHRHRPIVAPKMIPADTTEESFIEMETTEHKVDAALLDKVIDDVKQLIKIEQEDKATAPESAFCNFTGDWDTDAGGVQIRIDALDQVCIVEKDPPPPEPGFLDVHWSLEAHKPLNHTALIMLTGISKRKKRVVAFIGECRVCEGEDTITGSWMIGRKSKSCKDRQEALTLLSDVLRRNNVRRLQAEHLQEISAPPHAV